jgi:O-antigen/teichoic acid export membrane protein
MDSRVEISKRLVLINSGSALLSQLIKVSVLLWLHQFLLRQIGPEQYQVYAVLMSVVILLPLLTAVLTAGIGRFVVAAYAKGDDREITQIVSTMFPLLLGAGALICAGGMVFSWYVDRILTIAPGQIWDARIMMALLFFSIATRPPCAAFSVGPYVRQKFVMQNVAKLCGELLRLLLLFALLFGVSTRILWVVVANVAAELALSAALIVMSLRLVPALRFRIGEIRWELFRRLTSFGWWNFLASAAARLQETAVPIMLNRMTSEMELSVFYLGTMPRRQVDQWGLVMVAPLLPVVTGMHAAGAQDRIRSLYLRGGRIGLWIALAVALPAIVYARELIELYVGHEYIDVAFVMAMTLAGLVLARANWMMWHVANAKGRIRGVGVYSLLTQLAIVGITYYAVAHLGWGAVGAALTRLAVGAVLMSAMMWPLAMSLADVTFSRWIRRTWLPGLAPGCVSAFVWGALRETVAPNTWLEVGACTAAGLACYVTVLLAFCLEPNDRRDLTAMLGTLRSYAGRRKTSQRNEVAIVDQTPVCDADRDVAGLPR